jgi:hypothetical protein
MCEHININGQDVIVCGVRVTAKYCECGHRGIFLCDWKIRRGEKLSTCDKPICARHAKEVAPGKHLCPEHQLEYDGWKKRHPEADVKRGEQQGLFQESAA